MNAPKTGPVAAEMLAPAQLGAFADAIELIDDSEQHRGHGGYNPAGESHFTLRIESPAFAGKSRVERQRMIYAALGDLMDERVHALVDPRDRAGRMMMATIETRILQTITPVTHDLGDFKVNRTLPARERTMVGPFIFVDEFGPARLPAGQGMDVRPHPHINLATVTYLFEGAIEHRDSIGIARGDRARRDQPDDRGQRHRSFGALAAGAPAGRARASTACRPGSRCPTAGKRSTRRSTMSPADGLPLIEDGGARARVLMGTLWGATRATPLQFADHLCRHRARRRRRDPDRCRGRRARA